MVLVIELVSLGPFYFWIRKQLDLQQDSRIQFWLQRLSSRCASASGAYFEVGCLVELRQGSGFIEPFVEVVLLDQQGEALYHSDLSRGDSLSQPAVARKIPYLRTVASARLSPVRDGGLRIYWTPFIGKDGSEGGRWAAAFDDARLRASLSWLQEGVKTNALQFALFGVGAGLLLAMIVAWHVLSPLQRMLVGMDRVAAGKFDQPLPVERDDELGFLAIQFNSMAARLKDLDELKEKLIHSITHDLRSPMTAILGYAELMMGGTEGPLTETQVAYLSIICKNMNRLAGYINDILDVAKMQAGKMDFDKKPVSIVAIVESVVELLAVTAREMNVELQLQSAVGVPRVMADVDMLSRVVTNLVSNAIKFTPKGGMVTISVSRADPINILVSVKDTGVGIPEDKLETIFDKFYQVSETKGAARKAGTGSGLTITKEIIEGHGGKVWVESKAGQGADFKFTLPVLFDKPAEWTAT